jgi:hypothetical protein
MLRFMHDLLGSFVKHTTNIENKNTLPGEILQCCRGASYILLATWKNTLGYQKPLGYDNKLNVLNMFSFAMSSVYSKPSGRILKLYYYSVFGKFSRDFFYGGLRNVDNYRAQVLFVFS